MTSGVLVFLFACETGGNRAAVVAEGWQVRLGRLAGPARRLAGPAKAGHYRCCRERPEAADRSDRQRVGGMPIAESRKREAALGISEVERRSRSERSWRDPSGQRLGAAVRAFSGVPTALPIRPARRLYTRNYSAR